MHLMRARVKKFRQVHAKLLERKKCTCDFCNYVSERNTVININGNYQDNRFSNLAVACDLCARCQLMDYYKLDYEGSDVLIFFDGLSQEQFNHFIRVLFCKLQTKSEEQYNAQMVYSKLQDRARLLDEQVGFNLSNPGMFMHFAQNKNTDKALLSRIRLLPSPDALATNIKNWQEVLHNQLR